MRCDGPTAAHGPEDRFNVTHILQHISPDIYTGNVTDMCTDGDCERTQTFFGHSPPFCAWACSQIEGCAYWNWSDAAQIEGSSEYWEACYISGVSSDLVSLAENTDYSFHGAVSGDSDFRSPRSFGTAECRPPYDALTEVLAHEHLYRRVFTYKCTTPRVWALMALPWPQCVRCNGPTVGCFLNRFDVRRILPHIPTDAYTGDVEDGCTERNCRKTEKFYCPSPAFCAWACSQLSSCQYWNFGEENGHQKCWVSNRFREVNLLASFPDCDNDCEHFNSSNRFFGTSQCQPPYESLTEILENDHRYIGNLPMCTRPHIFAKLLQ